MSDSIAKYSAVSRLRFLSLKWKSALTLICILTALLILLSWHFYDQYQRDHNGQLAALRLRQIDGLEKTLHRSGEILHHLVDAIVIDAPIAGTFTEKPILAVYQQRLRNFLPKITHLWAVDEAVIVSSDNKLIEQMSATADHPPLLVSWISAAGRQNFPLNSVSIVCTTTCLQVLTFPIIEGNTRLGTLAISRNLQILQQQFNDHTDSHLLLFGTGSDNTLTSKPATSSELYNPTNFIPSWNGNLLLAEEDPALTEIVRVASKQFSYSSVLGATKSLQYNHQTFAVSFFPIRGYEDLSLRYLLVSNISKQHQLLLDQMSQDVLITFCLVAVFAVYLIISNWRHFGRVKQQIAVLPMLGQKQFKDVRNIVHKNRRQTLFRDELDVLDDAVMDFSYQLESLEKAVNVRTREMERLSLFDTLTGLANRNLLQYELQSDVQRYLQQGGVLGIVILDLDKFKRINDSIGHQLGDMLLGKIGSRLKNATRSLGLVARLGGDEFAIILRSAKKVGQIEMLCQKIIELIRKPLELDDHSISISCSLGVALAGSKQSADDMIKNAEIAMYKAKENGGNSYRVFNPNMATEAHANLSLEADIRRAFENREFTLFLQPKVSMESQIMGFEALIRWDHPDRGLVPPVEFIPAMENMGLISQLDNFVLDASCRQLKVLQTHYPEISIAVNISSTHFTDKNFLVFLKSCLDKYPIDPSRLELEITETLLMENMSVGLEIIEQIKEFGVSIAIDDFGTGYSSLSYLKKLPVDTIKIDREFIKDIPESESDMQISSVIIFLAKQLNFTVVAEGVETSEQLVFLKANQCDLAQGYLFSKPIPAHKAMILLESQWGGKKLGIA